MVALQRVLGRRDGVSLMIACIIGSGIFASPGVIVSNFEGARGEGFLVLLAWVLAAAVAALSSLVYGELGTLFQHSSSAGADYTFIQAGLGDAPAFAWAFSMFWVIKPGGLAIIGLTFAQYARRCFVGGGAGAAGEGGGGGGDASIRAVAVLTIMLFTGVNCLTVKLASRVMNAFAAIKVLLVAALCALMAVQLARSTAVIRGNFSGAPSWDGGRAAAGMGPALVASLWAFDGWNDICFMAEELRSPGRDVAPIITVSTAIVTVVYFICNIAYMSALPLAQIAGTDVVAVDTAMRVGGTAAATAISFLVACCTLGTLTGSLMVGGRFIYATARDGQVRERSPGGRVRAPPLRPPREARRRAATATDPSASAPLDRPSRVSSRGSSCASPSASGRPTSRCSRRASGPPC